MDEWEKYEMHHRSRLAFKPGLTGMWQACGLRHLAFCVESVEQTVNELAEVGIECEPIRVDDYTGKKMTFFHDPDGLPLELHE